MSTAAAEYAKFLPEGIPPAQMPFWDSLKARAVQVQRCDNCGKYLYIPKDICNNCHSEQLTWTPISGHGEIYTYTVVRRAPTPAYAADAPYTLVHVTMDEGFRMIAKLNGVAPEDVRIGAPVRITYEEVTPEWTLMEFEPAPASAGAER
jgi:uncharacterized protein